LLMMAPSYLEVGASGKPGAVQTLDSCLLEIFDDFRFMNDNDRRRGAVGLGLVVPRGTIYVTAQCASQRHERIC
jgi:hypothetical protein